MQRAWLAGAVLAAAAVLCGCVTHGMISSRAVDYNVAAESARNEMLLLNVLRSRDRKPMVFTGLTSISGSLRTSAGIGVGLATGPDAADVQTFAPGAEIADAPTFDVAVLDSQEFTRGIMTPIGFDILEYFWDQGFNREVLFYLTVERMEIECPGAGDAPATLRRIENDPTDPTFEEFRALLGVLVDDGEWEPDASSIEPIGGILQPEAGHRLESLLQVAGSGLELRPLPDGSWRLERPASGRRLAVPGFAVCPGSAAAPIRLYDAKDAFESAALRAPGESRGRLVLRSPQAVLFYLGELTRPGVAVAIRARQPSQPESTRRLFTLREAAACPRADVQVAYDGARWAIPRGGGDCDPGRSMQSLALAAQLLALQQSSRDLPATGTLRVVGQ